MTTEQVNSPLRMAPGQIHRDHGHFVFSGLSASWSLMLVKLSMSSDSLRATFFICLAGVILSWPAFYNGYPLVWWDTPIYLEGALRGVYLWEKSPFYGLAIRPLLLARSQWPIIFVQSLIAAYLIYLTLRTTLSQFHTIGFLVVVAVLAGFTSLPWHTTMIMADIFTPIVILSVFLIGFAHDRLTRTELVAILIVACLATLVHLEHLVLVGALGAFSLLIMLVRGRAPRKIARSAMLILVPIVVALAGHLAFQISTTGIARISPYGSIMLLARFIEDGQAQPFLREHCATRQFVLCDHVGQLDLTSDQFLWPTNSLFYRVGGRDALVNDATQIVIGSIREHPLWHLKTWAKNTYAQLLFYNTDGGISDFNQTNQDARKFSTFMKSVLPEEYGSYVHGLQSSGNLHLEKTTAVDLIVVTLSVIISLAMLPLLAIRRDWQLVELFGTIVVALIANAFVCGVFAPLYARYESRVIWLLPLFALLAVLATWRPALRAMRQIHDTFEKPWRRPQRLFEKGLSGPARRDSSLGCGPERRVAGLRPLRRRPSDIRAT